MFRHNGIKVGIDTYPIAVSFLRLASKEKCFTQIAQYDLLQDAGRALWAELHQEQRATPEWFADWLARIPRFGCTCDDDFQAILERIPSRYG